jgi:hypothetical protein
VVRSVFGRDPLEPFSEEVALGLQQGTSAQARSSSDRSCTRSMGLEMLQPRT